MQELFDNIFLIPLFVATIIQLLFIFGLYARLAFFKREENNDSELLPLSIIIASKNEDENLEKFIPLILQQDYPDFEVIVVDDKSEDNSPDLLFDMAKNHPNLKIVSIGEHIRDRQGKKFALSLGIRKAVNPILVFTDADCYPISNQWLRMIARNYNADTDIVIGHSPVEHKNSFLNLFIQFDNYNTALQCFSFALAKMPYMGVGRNLSYRKSLFDKGGFSTQLHIPYGDDDIFVNRNADSFNTSFEIDPASFVNTTAHTTLFRWFRQKVRHLKAGIEYKNRHKFWLGMNYFSIFLFYILFLAAVMVDPMSLLMWFAFGIRFISYISISFIILKKLQNKKLIWFLPFIEVLYQLILMPIFSMAAKKSSKNSW